MNYVNNPENPSRNSKVTSSQRDFNKNTRHKRNIFSAILSAIYNLDTKIKCIVSLIITLALMFWVFTGSHNSNEKLADNNISEEIQLPDIPVAENEHQTHVEIEDLTDESNTTVLSNKVDNYIETSPKVITKTIKIKKNENLSSLFNQLKISKDDLNKIITDKKISLFLKKIKSGQDIEISYNSSTHQLVELSFPLDKLTLFKILQDPDNTSGLVSRIEKLKLTEHVNFAKLKIKSSLFEDAQKIKLPTELILQIIDIFTWDIDFAQDLRINDYVEILYKEYYLHGSYYTHGPILAVNFHNNGSTYSAVRYDNHNGANYYTPQGLSLRKAFIRTPVKFTRISSKFNLGRKHPLLHKIRAHRGVDYAAPTGTPIKAAGDGVIIEYTRKGGYGKAAVIQHGAKYTTVYAHMSQYNAKLKVGSSVKQGDIIGYVGQTGLASGPHLHFEFRVNGVHQNPLTVALPKAQAINNKDKAKFTDHANKLASVMKKHIEYNNLNSNSLIARTKKFE